MKKIVGWWRSESALIIGILIALVNASLIPGQAGKILGAVLPVLGGGAVRQTVWAPDTAAGAVSAAATSVASQLTTATAGPAGTVTAAAQGVVDRVVTAALGGD